MGRADRLHGHMQGVKVYLSSQCTSGDLQPELYRAGSAALEMGVEGGPQMTPEVHTLDLPLSLCRRGPADDT